MLLRERSRRKLDRLTWGSKVNSTLAGLAMLGAALGVHTGTWNRVIQSVHENDEPWLLTVTDLRTGDVFIAENVSADRSNYWLRSSRGTDRWKLTGPGITPGGEYFDKHYRPVLRRIYDLGKESMRTR